MPRSLILTRRPVQGRVRDLWDIRGKEGILIVEDGWWHEFTIGQAQEIYEEARAAEFVNRLIIVET